MSNLNDHKQMSAQLASNLSSHYIKYSDIILYVTSIGYKQYTYTKSRSFVNVNDYFVYDITYDDI